MTTEEVDQLQAILDGRKLWEEEGEWNDYGDDLTFIRAVQTALPKALVYAMDMRQHAQEWEEQYNFIKDENDRLKTSLMQKESTPEAKSLIYDVLKEQITGQRDFIRKQSDEVGRLKAALDTIAFMETDCAAADDLESFYNSQLKRCISIAANALRGGNE